MSDNIYEGIEDTTSIIKNPDVLDENYNPDEIVGRDDILYDTIPEVLGKPIVQGNRIPNIRISGNTGTGKSLVTNRALSDLEEYVENFDVDVTTLELSGQSINTAYQLFRAVQLEAAEGLNKPAVKRGLPENDVKKKMEATLNQFDDYALIVIDEIHQIGAEANGPLYSIARETNKQVAVIAIHNDWVFPEKLNKDTLDSLDFTKIQFSDYDADQMTAILRSRVDKAFVRGSFPDAQIKQAAGAAAKDQGSARQGLMILEKAANRVDDRGGSEVTREDVENAKDEVEKELVARNLNGLPVHSQLAAAAVADAEAADTTPVATQDLYVSYERMADMNGDSPISRGRFYEHMANLDERGIAYSEYDKRTGRTKRWKLDEGTSPEVVREVLTDGKIFHFELASDDE